MDRRKFLGAAAMTAAAAPLAMAGKDAEEEGKKCMGEHGACGLSCNACRMKLNGKCKGCGIAMKAKCPILTCAQDKNLEFCGQCKGYPCDKIKKSGKFGEKWMKKIAEAPLPDGENKEKKE
jgi:hypothetical protein